MRSLWLILAQYQILPPAKHPNSTNPSLVLGRRSGLLVSFEIFGDPPGTLRAFRFPFPLQLTPIPSPLGAKFCSDLSRYVNLDKLPEHMMDMQILDLKYPIPFPLDWWEIAKYFDVKILLK